MSINLSKIESEYFCAAPWVNLHVNFTGHVKPCCYGSQAGYQSVHSESWNYSSQNQPELTHLKQQLVSGTEPAYCVGCHERAWYSEFLNPDLVVNDLQDFHLKSVDVRWGTTCQLSCTYCDQWNSSTWAALENRVDRTIPIIGRSYKNKYDELFDFINQHRDHISRVNLLGGEPLLLNENHRLLEAINPDTQIEIFTNLNVDLESNRIYNKLIGRSAVTWRISMENVGDRFEFVRRGANWDLQVSNLKKLQQDLSGSCSTMSTQSQFCAYSATRMHELYDFVDTVPGLYINWSLMLNNPQCLNFFRFPDRYKITALEFLDRQITHIDEPQRQSLFDLQQAITQSLKQEQLGIIQSLIDFHKIQEHKYFDDKYIFTDLWPEYLSN
jgi:organic radical activating enzyme